MTKYYLYKPIYTLLFALVCLTSCNGQFLSHSGNRNELKSTLVPQPKLTITQGAVENQMVSCGVQDRKGNIWFGTTSEGVYRYDGKLFSQFTKLDGLSSNCVWSMLEDRSGNIWFGTAEGICCYDGKKINNVSIPFFIRPVITDNSFYNDWSTKSTVWSIMQDKNGMMWFGTGDGVYQYDRFVFTRFLANDNIINKGNLKLKLVSDMLEDKNGNIWFASGMPPGFEGFCRFDGKMIESFKPKNEGWFRKVVQSKNGNLLLATRRYGVWTYDGKSFTDYSQPKDLLKE